MIVHPAEHLFQAKFPTLEPHEEEVFFHHPEEEIYCNQLGVLYFEPGTYVIYEKNDSSMVRRIGTKKTSGSKMRIIWECYTGQKTTNPHFLYVNGNPLDTRFENLRKTSELSKTEWEILQKTKKRFIQKSVDYLLKLEARADKIGMDKEGLYKILMLPYWLISARIKNTTPPVRTTRFVNTKCWTTPEEADEVEKLYHQGLTYYAIVKIMGWRSTNRVKKVIRDRKLVR